MSERLYHQTVTVYNRLLNPVGSTVTLVRCVVENCTWEEESINIYRNTGTVTSNQIMVIFPRLNRNHKKIPIQLSTQDFGNMPVTDLSIFKNYYTLALASQNRGGAGSIIIKGLAELDYPGGWVTTATLTTWTNANFTTAATRQYEGRTVQDVNFSWYGKDKLHHILVR